MLVDVKRANNFENKNIYQYKYREKYKNYNYEKNGCIVIIN